MRIYEELGLAIERAAKDLPEGYELNVTLEKGSGVVSLTIIENEVNTLDFYQEEYFHDNINQAVDYAIKHHKEIK